MANSPQSIKRARQAEKRRRANQGIGTKFRTMLKRAAASAGDADAAQTAFSNMQSAADVAARKGIIHPRKAARLKRRVNNLIRNKAAEAAAAAEAAKAEAAAAEAREADADEDDSDEDDEEEDGEDEKEEKESS